MAGSDALLASLLLGQKQRRDPLEIYQSFGKQQLQAGTSTAPLGSGNPLEGVARALQGGIGGLMHGYAAGKQEEQDQGNIDALSKATTATTPQDIAAALKGVKGNSEMMIPVLGQIIQSRLDQAITQQKAGGMLPQYGMGTGAPAGGVAAAPPQGGGITTAPLPQQTVTSPDNNPGNIRATSIPWDGKGQPQNGFETFNSPQAGANAQFKNFGAYVQANPNITVAQALAQWSPPNENNTQSIISQIAENTGINPGMPLADVLKDPAMAAQLLDAQTRREKGGLPQGFSADTFMTATGGQAAPPSTQAAAPQVAQAGPPQALQQPPAAPQAPQQSPAGQQLRAQAMRAQQAGDNVTALKFAQQATEEDAKWATEAGKIQLQGAEHDRQQNTATPNPEQALSGGFSDRMQNSERLIRQYGQALTSAGAKAKDMLPFGVGNYAQTAEYQQARQARDDFINAQLRRESGAAIAPTEYANADRQYFPQPGDSPEVIAQKAQNRQLAIEGMVRNAGPAYQQSPSVGRVQPPTQQGGGDLISQARQAIAQGAPRDQVIARLRAQGIDAGDL